MEYWDDFVGIVKHYFGYFKRKFGFELISPNQPFIINRSQSMGIRIYLEDRSATEFELDVTTAKDASAHDSQVMDKLVHGEEQSVYEDKVHSSAEKKKAYEGKWVKLCVNLRGSRGHQLLTGEEAVNHLRSWVWVKWSTLSLVHKA